MSQNIKRYMLRDTWLDWAVILEVNHDQLTEERATLINQFWSGDDYRLDNAEGDVVKAVIKLAASTLVTAFLRIGGGNVAEGNEAAALWTRDDLHNHEGWGGQEDNVYGWCGIRLVSADVGVDIDLDFVEVA